MPWYAIIDCAQDPRLAGLVRQSRNALCLFKGKLAPDLLDVSPWLVLLDETEQLLPAWQQYGRGRNWGLMALSDLPIAQLQRHFRRFLQARLPDGTIALFRFYDPRVFTTYIRAATPEEQAPWFNGVQQYGVETADGQALHQYRLADGALFDGGLAVR